MKVFAHLMLLWSLALPVAAFVPPRGNVGRRMPTVGSTADKNQRSTDDNDNDYWNSKYKLLKQFYGMYEHHHVPVNWGDTELRGWVLEQAEMVNENNLPKERRELLADVGIVHSPEWWYGPSWRRWVKLKYKISSNNNFQVYWFHLEVHCRTMHA